MRLVTIMNITIRNNWTYFQRVYQQIKHNSGTQKYKSCLIFSSLLEKIRDILLVSVSLGFFGVLYATIFFLIFDRML